MTTLVGPLPESSSEKVCFKNSPKIWIWVVYVAKGHLVAMCAVCHTWDAIGKRVYGSNRNGYFPVDLLPKRHVSDINSKSSRSQSKATNPRACFFGTTTLVRLRSIARGIPSKLETASPVLHTRPFENNTLLQQN